MSRTPLERALTGEEVRIFRKSRGLSQTELGAWLGVTKQGVQNYEERGMNRQQALALAALDRGLQPWTPTEADRKAAREAKDSK